MGDVMYTFTFKRARLNDGKVEVLGEFQTAELDGQWSWIWFEHLQRMMDAYCERSGDTLQQAVDRLNRDLLGDWMK